MNDLEVSEIFCNFASKTTKPTEYEQDNLT